MFLLDRITPGLPLYSVPTLVRVRCTLDTELLRQAFETIVGRHEILRTTIGLIDGTPAQDVAPHRPFELSVADLRSSPRETALARAHELLADQVRRPFELDGDVLLRAAVVHVAAAEDLLLVVFHHIASDHASSRLLFAELDALYTGLRTATEPDLPELSVQYGDFAEWQRERLEGELRTELLDYWTDKLAGVPERLDLPTDRPRPSVQSYRGALREFSVEPAIVSALRELARVESVSFFVVLLAAFKTLLHRYSGADDMVVGVPVSGRQYEEIESLLGFFSNTLAVRTDLSGDPTFSELLARVKATMLEARVFQELPFEKLVEALNPGRAQSHSPIFQVLLGFDVAPAKPPELAGQMLEQLPVPGWEWSRFDLSIVLRERADGSVHAELEYATDLFDGSTVDRLIRHFQTLLEAISESSHQPLSALRVLTDQERDRLLVDWNSTSHTYDRRCLHDLFSDQAQQSPDSVAVVCGKDLLTYSELDRRSNQLARELQSLGVAVGTLVGVCVERSGALMVALLGVLKSGAGYVPIEPTYPPQRQEFMLADSGASVLITEERLLGLIDPRGRALVCIDRDWNRIGARSADPLGEGSDPEQLAYVIYTSGSTGQPKGVAVRHRSVANLIAEMRERPGIGECDVLANVTTPAFDLSVPDWYLPLTTGARLVIVPREATLDGVELADWLARMGVTIMQATPTTWQLLVDAGWSGSPSLKIVCGGEALPPTLAADLISRGASLWHMYGPTETTVWSSILALESGDGPLPLGGPIANTSFFVLDAHRQPVPIGIPGELYIGGEGVAAGYHARPELTAEKFVRAEFAAAGSEPLYRTGDLVRWRDDGTLEFLGRIDQQVKLRGFRIELGEIESALASHPSVAAAVAAVREVGPGDRRLVAYVTPGDGTPEVDELRRLLKGKLPLFMLPSTFVMLESLPLNANGKLDRAALPLPNGGAPRQRREPCPPETPVQEALATIWSEVLAVEHVGLDDDFFDLGGHSLLAVRMLARVQDSFGVALHLGGLFDSSTIRELADVVTLELIGEATEDEMASMLAEDEG